VIEDWAYGLLAIGFLFIIMAMFSIGRSRKRKTDSRDSGRDHIERVRQKAGVRDELEMLMVDINRMAKDLGGQLDAKIIRIEQAVREADERIAQLDALRSELNQPLSQPQIDAAHHAHQSHHAQQTDQLITPQAPASQADRITHEVYALADQGLGPSGIAERLGEHVGKVELILALRTG